MTDITFTGDSLRHIALFNAITGATAIDCLDSKEKLVMVVRAGEIGRAVGRKGTKVSRLKRLLRKDVQIVEHSSDPAVFLSNYFRNYGVREVTLGEKGGKPHAVVSVDPARKGRAIGRQGRNLRLARDLVSRHHGVESVVIA